MFNLFKKKGFVIKAPCNGTTVPLSEVNDPTFSQEMIGKGIAIKPEENEIVSPVNGTITMVFPTHHALGIKSEDGIEILIHIGLDTVNMKGEGFTLHIKENDKVKIGDSLITVDFNKLKEAGYDNIIPIIITNTPSYSSIEGNTNITVHKGDTILNVK